MFVTLRRAFTHMPYSVRRKRKFDTPNGKLPAGGDTFTYTVSDGQGGTYTATVAVRDFSETAATFNGLIVSADSANPVDIRDPLRKRLP